MSNTAATLRASSSLTLPRVALTRVSSNGKVGPIPVSTTEKASCPFCPFKGNGCYAEAGPLALFWAKVSDGRAGLVWEDFIASVSDLPAEILWRHNQAGDLPGEGDSIHAEGLAQLVKANGKNRKRGFTYTHKPVLSGQHAASNRAAIKAANAGGFTVNLSGNTLAEVDALVALDIGPVVAVLPIEYARNTAKGGDWAETVEEYRARVATLPSLTTPDGNEVKVCPAVYLDTNCAACGLCQRQNRKVSVGFPAHGASKRKAGKVAAG
jgi:hypothetical protein